MPTSPPSVTSLPTPPSRSDPANFSTRGDAFLTALPTFQTDTNAVAANAYANAVEAASSATAAASSATASAASATTASGHATSAANNAATAAQYAGAALWVSGTTYAVGAVVYSPVTFLVYRRKIAGAGTTDPSADTTNWAFAVSQTLPLVIVTGTTVSASAGGAYALTAAGATTLTLPASPVAGDAVDIIVANGRTDNVIDRNGSNIMGLGENMTMNISTAALRLRYVNSTLGWRITP
jgi:hypothetical protein